ncbi:putative integral membrane protein [Synechococcus sp. PCC 7502]|uniref:YggT family protein n=1 Tax=Synechococcus sp. PCC 7502 TaxID=1173263 RepID=UPI00029F85C4|nr:YggT family protein [Synechococcus sp. PCC 7502]AFY73901.1 putative integral membrane protein [Synechococcus sp. PCC 7502]
MEIILQTVLSFISIYLALLFIRVLLTWFPNVNWSSQPFAALSQVTDPYLNVFRSIIPPVSGMDFSPMLAFLVLSLLQRTLASAIGVF